MDFVSNLIPNKSAMLEHVHHLFDGAPGGHAELAWTDEFTKALSCAKQYALTDLDQLVEKAAEVNATAAGPHSVGPRHRRHDGHLVHTGSPQ